MNTFNGLCETGTCLWLKLTVDSVAAILFFYGQDFSDCIWKKNELCKTTNATFDKRLNNGMEKCHQNLIECIQKKFDVASYHEG